jgi:hypothetical protein
MPQNGGISNKEQNQVQASQEMSLWLRERLAYRALPLQGSTPSLLSTIRQQPRHLGESSGRLARWVIARDGLASVILRAIHLPLLSRAYDFIMRKTAFVSSEWPRIFDLQWLRQGRKQRRSFTQTAGGTADGKLTNNISLRPNERYPNTLLQGSLGAEEEWLGNEADETYPLGTDETYPLITSHLLLPPVTGRGLLTTASSPMHDTDATTLPLQTKEIADRAYPSEFIRTFRVARKERPVLTADEAYPAVIKNLFSPLVVGERIPGTSPELPNHARATSMPVMTKQTTGALETHGTDNLTVSPVSQSRIPIPGRHQSRELQTPDQRHLKDSQERPAQINQQPQHTYPDQLLPQVLTPVTQRTTLQRRPIGVRPHLTSKSIRENQTSPIQFSYHSETIGTEEVSSSLTAGQTTPPLIAGMPGDASKRPDQPVVPGTANKPAGMVSYSLLPRKVITSESSRVDPQRAPEISQAKTGEPVIRRQTKQLRQEAEVTHIPEDVADLVLSPDMLNLVTPEHGRIDRSFTKGYTEKPLFYRELTSIADSAIQPSLMKSISRAIILPSQRLFKSAAYVPLSAKSENYGLLRNRESVPSSPSYEYARQPALELPVVSSARPKVDFSVAHSEELFRHMADTVPQLTYSGNHNVPEPALVPAGRVPETKLSLQPATTETQGEQREGEEAAPDVRALAREIYPLMKRMLMVERERRPTW